jgi:integrase
MTVQRRRRAFTDKSLAALPRKTQRYVKADPGMLGHFLRVPPCGPVVFTATARGPYGKQHWTTLGNSDHIGIEAARALARTAIGRMKAGLPGIAPVPPAPDSVETKCLNWLDRVVDRGGFRTGVERRRIVEKYIVPHPPFRDRSFVSIKRSELAVLLDHIEDAHGPHMADQVLSVLQSVASWVASRDDSYTPPFVKGMRRVPKEARERSRILSDSELKTLWLAAEDAGSFGAIVRLLLLTAQRLEKVTSLRWRDITADGTWIIPRSPREKSTIGKATLPQIALDIIRTQPRILGVEYVFPQRDHNVARSKRIFDQTCDVSGWRLHDLRRTARSLLSRPALGVTSDVAELVLGHSLRGVRGTYDRHSYGDEKSAALAALADEIVRIVEGPEPANNILKMAPAVAS